MLSIKHFYWDVGLDVEGSHTLHLLVFLLCPSRLLMESYHRHATSWLLILVINVFAASKLWLIVTIMCISLGPNSNWFMIMSSGLKSLRESNSQFLMRIILFSILPITRYSCFSFFDNTYIYLQITEFFRSCWITFFLDVLQQLVQKSFARLYFNDYLRNSRLVSSCQLLSLSFVNQTVRKTYLLNIYYIWSVYHLKKFHTKFYIVVSRCIWCSIKMIKWKFNELNRFMSCHWFIKFILILIYTMWSL